MSGLDGRADRLYPALTAQERALLVLEAANADRRPAWQVRSTMPAAQVAEFNRYIAIMRGVATLVTPYAAMIEQDVTNLQLRFTLLATLSQWATDRAALADYIALHAGEPCTAGEFADHVVAARADYLGVELAADAVIEARGLCTDAASTNRSQHERNFARIAKDTEAELRQLVQDGVLTARGRGHALELNVGALYDWLGQPAPVLPEWGRRYEVVADGAVAWQREVHRRIHERVSAGPHTWLLPDEGLSPPEQLMRALRERLCTDLPKAGSALMAIEAVLAEVAAELGADPAPPTLTESMARTRANLAALLRDGPLLLGAIGPPDCDEIIVGELRELLRGADERV